MYQVRCSTGHGKREGSSIEPHLEEAQRFIKLAERDVKAFQVLKDAPGVDLSSIGFHAQQVIEKSLKAVLFFGKIGFSRTHDLIELSELLLSHQIEIPVAREILGQFNPFAVIFRYDDLEMSVFPVQEMDELVLVIFNWAKERIWSATGDLAFPSE